MLPNQCLENNETLVLVGGSRFICGAGLALARRVGSVLAARGVGLSVGCASGVDAAVLAEFVGAGAASRARVFAVGRPSGAGFPVRGVPIWVAEALEEGAEVVWEAGGPVSGAGWLPLRVRLARRSRAAAAGVSAAVFVVGSPESRGSFGTARFCAAQGVPVFVLPVGFSPSLLPSLGVGRWVLSNACSSLFGSPCFKWESGVNLLPETLPEGSVADVEKPEEKPHEAGQNRQHIVFCPKYRRSVLVGPVKSLVQQSLSAKCAELGVEIIALSVMPDHVHLVARVPKKLSMSEVVRHLKGSSARVARQACPNLRETVHQDHLWAKRFFSVSVGSGAAAKVRKYVENQAGAE